MKKILLAAAILASIAAPALAGNYASATKGDASGYVDGGGSARAGSQYTTSQSATSGLVITSPSQTFVTTNQYGFGRTLGSGVGGYNYTAGSTVGGYAFDMGGY